MKISEGPGRGSGNPRDRSRMKHEDRTVPEKKGDNFVASQCSWGLSLCNPGFRVMS